MKIYLLSFVVIFFYTNNLNSQSSDEIELHNRYWTYRENFRKYLTNIGKEQGQSLPYSNIRLAEGDVVRNLSPIGLDLDMKKLFGKLENGGDLTYYFAEYLGVLSTEYWLLTHQTNPNAEDIRAVEIELYYALNAIERLDKYSQTYYDPLNIRSTTPLDGFFVRDDSDPHCVDFLNDLNYPYVKTMTAITSDGRGLDYNKSNYAAHKYVSWLPEKPTEYFRYNNLRPNDAATLYRDAMIITNYGNEMSMDQLIGVFFGFKCVMKFVDVNLNVDPDGPNGIEESKNLHAWVKILTDKMMLHLSQTTYDIKLHSREELDSKRIEWCQQMNDSPYLSLLSPRRYGNGSIRFKDKRATTIYDPCEDWRACTNEPFNPQIAAHATYVLTNPHRVEKKVDRGPYAFGFGYPLEKIGEEITGNNYNEVSLTLSAGVQLARYVEEIFMANIAVGYGSTLLATPDGLSLAILGRPFQPHNPSWWRDLYNKMPTKEVYRKKLKKSTAAGMLIWLPAASGTWSQQDYFELMDVYNRKEADLFWAVLNDEDPIVSASSIENLLLRSRCESIQNEANESIHYGFNKMSHFSKIAKDGGDFRKNHIFDTETTQDDRDDIVLYNGLDWMLIYNFYRMADAKNLEFKKSNTARAKAFPFWKGIENNNPKNQFQRLPKYENNYCPCKSSYDFYSDRSVYDNQPFRFYDYVPISQQPFSINPYPYLHYRDLGDLKMFNKKYESFGIHLNDYLVHNFVVATVGSQKGILAPKGNLTICNSTLRIANGGTLKTNNQMPGQQPFYKGQTITIGKNGILDLRPGGTLTIADNTRLIIEDGGKLLFYNGSIINLVGPNSQLIVRGIIELQEASTFKINITNAGLDNIGRHGQVIIDRWYEEFSNTPPPFTSTHGNGRLNFIGFGPDDYLLTIIGNDGLTVSSEYIEQATFKNCRVSFAEKDAKLLLEPRNSIWIENVLFDNKDKNDLMYQGIQIAGSTNYIFNSNIKHARIGIDFNYLKRNGNPDALNLKDVNFDKCMIAVRTNGSMSYIGGTVNKYGEVGIQNIGDNNGTLIQNVSFFKSNSVGLDGKDNAKALTKPLIFQGTYVLLRRNLFGNDLSSGLDVNKAKLYNNKSILFCNVQNPVKLTPSVQSKLT